MKKILKFILLPGLILLLIFSWRNGSNPSSLIDNYTKENNFNCPVVYVYNLTTDKTELDINGGKKRPPASLTKMMTVYCSLNSIRDLSSPAYIDGESRREIVEEDGSIAGFCEGEKVTLRDLLYGTMLPSGGECADSLAVNLSGSTENFVSIMNGTAKDLGMKHTCYCNPDGMDQHGQYTTARDQAKFLKAALQDENFRAIFTTPDYLSTPTYTHPQGLYMKSTVLSTIDPEMENGFTILGGKSGSTPKAGLCWATLAEKNGNEYIIIVMGAPFDDRDSLPQREDTLEVLNQL